MNNKSFTIVKLLLLIVLMLWYADGTAQSIVSGTVSDAETGETLPGVNILVKGTTQGTSTNSEGSYSLNASSLKDTLVVSFIGYQTQEIPIKGRTKIDMELQPQTVSGEELVVVGYGTQQRRDLSSSISSVDAEQVESNSVLPNAAAALEGTVAGVSATPADGTPGSDVNIRVRGTNSFGNNDPLVIIDGVPGNLNNINPSDIASMQVLKDAASAAIYGSRAANGVVIVETKSGRAGEINVNIKTSYGFQRSVNFIPVANSRQYAKIDNALHQSAGIPVYEALENPESLGRGTDWQNEVYDNAPIWKTYLNISGGDENATYSISGSLDNQSGIMQKTWYRKANLHFRGKQNIGNFTFGESLSWINGKGRTTGQGGGKNIQHETVMAQPVMSVYNPENIGGFGGPPSYLTTQSFNPLGILELVENTDDDNDLNIGAYVQYDFLNGFSYKLNTNYRSEDNFSQDYTPRYYFSNQRQNVRASLGENRNRNIHWLIENTLRYQQQFGKHNTNVLGGFMVEENQYRSTWGSKVGFPGNDLQVLDASTGFSINSGGSENQWNLISLLGRLNYNYDEKYYVTANIRRDGSSRFGQGNQYGFFPSASVAWRMSSEDFFNSLQPSISNLKLRASYGMLGNQPDESYSYIPSINFGSNLGYLFGDDFQTGATIESFANETVKWETTTSFNIGVDVGILNNLELTADYFLNKTDNVLLQVPIPPSTGASASPPLVNTGKLENRGVDLSLSYTPSKSREFNYSISGNISFIRNKVLELGYEGQIIYGSSPRRANTGPITAAKVGYPVGAFFMKQANGLFQSEQEVQEHSKDGNLIQPNAEPGDVRYVDVNNDGQINASDTKYSGSPFPDFSYGLNFSANYKNFDFSLFLQGTYGNKLFDSNTWITQRGTIEYNFHTDLLDAWTPQNKDTDIPRLAFNDPNNNSDPSTRFLYDASFLRIKNMQIGYTLSGLNQLGIKKLRLFVNSRNLWTITKYPGYDPSYTSNGLLNRGLDQGLYPISRVFTGGIDINF